MEIKVKENLTTIVLTLVVLFCVFKTVAREVSFRHLNINDGLSQNAVFAILQDSKGFMWFGTKDGLNRYDGYSFKVYQHNPFDTTTLSANYITALFEDSQKNIWVGTLNGGLNCLHPGSESFRRISLSSNTDSLQNDPEILSFTEDVYGNIWVGTNKSGLFRLSIFYEKGFEISKKQFLKHTEKINEPGYISVPVLFVDSNGTLWAGASNGLYRYNALHEDFTFFEITTKNSKAPESPDQKMVRSIIESNDGKLWLGTLSGLALFEKESGKFSKYPHHFEVYRYGWGIVQQIA